MTDSERSSEAVQARIAASRDTWAKQAGAVSFSD
jgi:hypothetical protein